jgi:hypothetical protein
MSTRLPTGGRLPPTLFESVHETIAIVSREQYLGSRPGRKAECRFNVCWPAGSGYPLGCVGIRLYSAGSRGWRLGRATGALRGVIALPDASPSRV